MTSLKRQIIGIYTKAVFTVYELMLIKISMNANVIKIYFFYKIKYQYISRLIGIYNKHLIFLVNTFSYKDMHYNNVFYIIMQYL